MLELNIHYQRQNRAIARCAELNDELNIIKKELILSTISLFGKDLEYQDLSDTCSFIMNRDEIDRTLDSLGYMVLEGIIHSKNNT